MHIPDGYLGPQTYLPAWAIMAPLWGWASARLKGTLRVRQAPQLALAAAFVFVIMMFNVPVPGGTTGHAVGAVLVAILLGPWAAMIAVSLALIVQALVFGDGGVTAIAANCLNMAVIMPLAGWAVYRLLAAGASPTSARRWIAGAVGGYVGLNAAAFTTAVMFGIQPLLARDAQGLALYAPYGLHIAVPVMMLEHLLFFGVIEGVVTGLAVAYFQAAAPEMLAGQAVASRPRPLWLRPAALLLLLALLTPVGLYLPEQFNAGAAWGEWSAEEVGEMVGYLPRGMERLGALWSAPVPDYALPGQEEAPLGQLSVTYVLSALLGISLLYLAMLGLRALFTRKESDDLPPGVDDCPRAV